MTFTLQFIGALLLDLLFGDPRALPHPVQGIGWLCVKFEQVTRHVFSHEGVAGTVSFILVFVCTLLLPGVILSALHVVAPFAEACVAMMILYTGIACRDLYTHSMQVYNALHKDGNIENARKEVAKIVGRDTRQLDRQGVCRACVETVAENLVDGITAPIFFAILFSFIPMDGFLSTISMAALGAYAYKSINTMDSMYGYKNEQYKTFGSFAARVDDSANFLPARISGLLLIVAAWMLRLDAKGAKRIFLRDRLQHASPNGGHPEAAVAGSLGIQLGGNSFYFGEIVTKATMGESLRPIEPRDIISTNHLMFLTSALFSLIFLGVHIIMAGV